ncbi:hypothetical protein [Alkanindiges illinoisensis]|uniref:hypothetical protein n=1 Tax=Alkanindiges illinoisensis TaxID=197183 RepID=UPI0012EBD930|nr:hypothetical protein [Alkanindiges illinoisensis]
MKNRRIHRIMEYHLQVASRTNNNLEAGYLWFFLAAGLVMGFMILSHMGIAS